MVNQFTKYYLMAKYITFDSQQTQNPNPININITKVYLEEFKKKL